ncbi:HAD-superfamily phosphatase [Dipodascopsis uninucleata]
MNITGTLHAVKVLVNPNLAAPHLRVPTLDQLPIPLSKALTTADGKPADIRAIVVDKDNCFAEPEGKNVWPAYRETWKLLKEHYGNKRMLVVSNSAGSSSDKDYEDAKELEKRIQVPVLRHAVKKPGCGDEIMKYFMNNTDVTHPSQVAIIGDRLLTDIVLANEMHAWGVWISVGVVPLKSFPVQVERWLCTLMDRCEIKPVIPPSK